MSVDDDYEPASGRSERKLYISKRLPNHRPGDPNARLGYRVFRGETFRVAREKGEVVLRTTSSQLQQVKAKFLEDDRGIQTLWIQRWSTKRGYPLGEEMVLHHEMIPRLLEFLEGIERVHIPSEAGLKVHYDKLVAVPDSVLQLLTGRPELIEEIIRTQITHRDVVVLAYRHEQLSVFRQLMDDPAALGREKERLRKSSTEGVWQDFFERNRWILGYALSFVFTTGLDKGKLERVTRGASILHPGKRPDGVMMTRAAISALCLVEIKVPGTDLLRKGTTYRSGTWVPSAELIGGVAQSQENVRVALEEFGVHTRLQDENGNPTGQDLMAVQPRSFLVIGNLNEFRVEHGINVSRYRAFEDYRADVCRCSPLRCLAP
jgi:hypothetical protein